VPELPDLTVVAEAFHASLAGRSVTAASAPGPLAVRGTPEELQALVGQAMTAVRRRGKFLVIDLERARVIVNPMLTGRFQLATPGTRLPTRTAFRLDLGSRSAAPPDAAAWTTGASWVPADDEEAEVRYRDPTQMGKVYLVPQGVERDIAGFGPAEIGPDADDPDLDIEKWRARIRPFRGELKALLRNQAFVAGIGNAYSDDILHAARLMPMRRRSTLASEEIDELYRATRRVLADAIEVLRVRVPPTFESQVRDFLAVHLKGGSPCPRCGTRISEIKAGGSVTSFCRGCQR
jgi:formamidopyrimidine-DNA glycosylase